MKYVKLIDSESERPSSIPAHDLEERPEDGIRVVVGQLLPPPRLSREVRLVLLAGPQNYLGVLSRPTLLINHVS